MAVSKLVKMVFVPLLVFVLVSDSHSQSKLPEVTRAPGTELESFFTIMGTRMRAIFLT
jgi:hypothetical protein